MNTSAIILLAIIFAFPIYLWIFHAIVRSATKASQQTQLIQIQTRMFRRLLEDRGVSQEEIQKLINGK